MNSFRCRHVAIAATFLILNAGLSYACGSMGLGQNRAQAFTSIGITLLAPMFFLVPLEWAFLNVYGNLGQRTTSAYLACLAAKPFALIVVYFGSTTKNLILGVIAAEATYSVAHFVGSLVILRAFFRLERANLVIPAILISTVIPWLYSLGVPLAYFLVAHVNRWIA